MAEGETLAQVLPLKLLIASRFMVICDVHLYNRYCQPSSLSIVCLSVQTPPLPGPSPGEGDDLVFSGAGSGCDMDDEDECIPVFDTGSGKGPQRAYPS